MAKHYNLAIIGGGPGGYSVAISAGKAKLSVVLFEKGEMGGTCLNIGCIPTKFLLDKAKTIEKIRQLSDLKIIKETGVFSLKKIQEEKKKTVKKLTNGVSWLLKKAGVNVLQEKLHYCLKKPFNAMGKFLQLTISSLQQAVILPVLQFQALNMLLTVPKYSILKDCQSDLLL